MQFVVQLTASAVVMLAIYSFVAVGFSLNFAVGRVFNFALAALYPVAGYITASLSKPIGLIAAVVVGLLVAGALGFAVEIGVFGYMRRRGSPLVALLLAALGLQLAVQGIVGAVWGTNAVYVRNPFPTQPLKLGPFTIGVLDLVTIVAAIVVVGGFLFYVYGTNHGRSLLAVAEAPSTASVVGIPVQRMRMVAGALGTLVAAPSGILLAMGSGLTPDVGNGPLLFAFAAVIVGGIGRVGGTLLGLVVLVAASSVAVYFLPTFWMQGVTFLILVAFMLWRPRGLLGGSRRRTQA